MKIRFLAFFVAFCFVVFAIAPAHAYTYLRERQVNTHDAYQDASTHEAVLPIANKVFYDDFFGKSVDTTYDYTFQAANSGAMSVVNGVARITLGAADDDDGEIATGIEWLGSKSVVMEARVRVNVSTATAVNIGLCGNQSTAADVIALTFSGTTLSTHTGTAAVFFWDPDATSDYVRCDTVDAGTPGTSTASSEVWSDAEWQEFKIVIDTDGDVTFYLNKSILAKYTTGITASTSLCGYVGAINRGGAVSNTVDIDYIRIYSRR